MTIVRIVAFSVLAALLVGCKPPSALDGPFGVVKGTVVDGQSLQVLADIGVSISNGTDVFGGKTDAAGVFSIICTQGSLTLLISAPYYGTYTATVSNTAAENDVGTIQLQMAQSTMPVTMKDAYILWYSSYYSATNVSQYAYSYGVMEGTFTNAVTAAMEFPDGYRIGTAQAQRSEYLYVNLDTYGAYFGRRGYPGAGAYTMLVFDANNAVVQHSDSIDGCIGKGTLSAPTYNATVSVGFPLDITWSFDDPSPSHAVSVVVLLTTSIYDSAAVAFCADYAPTTTQTTVPGGTLTPSKTYYLYVYAFDRAITAAEVLATQTYYPSGLTPDLNRALSIDIDSISSIDSRITTIN